MLKKRKVIWEERQKGKALRFPNVEMLWGLLLFSQNLLYKHEKKDYHCEDKGSLDDSFWLTTSQSTLTWNDITITQSHLLKVWEFLKT